MSPSHVVGRARDALGRLLERPWFSYLTLLLLQVKVLWGIWQYRDLAGGDEAAYYTRAFLWFKDLSVDLAWSPLYTAFLGTLMPLSTDAYVVTTLHRMIVVLVLGAMVLALMRRLLPPWIAWPVAAWWAVLPINFDTMSTVHLFAVIPVLSAWLLLLLRESSAWARGGAIAIMLVTTALVRNEYLVATLALALVCAWWEMRMAPRLEGSRRRGRASRLTAYAVPLLLAAAIVLFFYARAIYQFPDLWTGRPLARHVAPWSAHSGLGPKHTYNMCQVYASGYHQRHPEWARNPMLDCAELMESTFGSPTPSLTEMLRRNPAAVLRHFAWNLALTPSGIQLLLFNAAAGAENPDYFAIELHSRRALVLSLVLAAVLALGLGLVYRERDFWWEHWLKDRALGWLAILAVVAVAGPIILTQRPRPSYLFAQGIALMAITGMCVFAMSRRWPVLERASRWLPIGMVALLFAVPSYYRAAPGGRPLLALYERLAPFGDAFNRSDSVFLVSGYRLEMHEYVGHNYFTSPLVSYDYSLLDALPAGDALAPFLDREGINLFYVDEALWRRLSQDPLHRSFLTAPEAAGWRALASESGPRGTWMLLQKEPRNSSRLSLMACASRLAAIDPRAPRYPRPPAA